ncbi:unnamed protein product, partial [Ectocarpus fasciculatus]
MVAHGGSSSRTGGGKRRVDNGIASRPSAPLSMTSSLPGGSVAGATTTTTAAAVDDAASTSSREELRNHHGQHQRPAPAAEDGHSSPAFSTSSSATEVDMAWRSTPGTEKRKTAAVTAPTTPPPGPLPGQARL